jgi:hypothetical protein
MGVVDRQEDGSLRGDICRQPVETVQGCAERVSRSRSASIAGSQRDASEAGRAGEELPPFRFGRGRQLGLQQAADDPPRKGALELSSARSERRHTGTPSVLTRSVE